MPTRRGLAAKALQTGGVFARKASRKFPTTAWRFLVSVELELGQVLFAGSGIECPLHPLLVEHEVFHHQHVHVRGQEASNGILRCANDWLSTHIETRIDEHRTTRQPVKGLQESVETRVSFFVHRLYPCAV